MNDLQVKINCPSCRRQLKIRVKEMVPGRTKRCTYCQTVVRFTGDDGRKIQRSIDDLKRTLKKLSRGY